jgi:hypothetical protein
VARAWLVAAVSVTQLACGAALVPLRAESPPGATAARTAALHGLGRAVFAALSAGAPERLLFDDLALRTVLDSTGSSRANAIRQIAGPGLRAEGRALSLSLRGASYVGVCVQESSVEGPQDGLRLRADAWIIARVFLVAQHPRDGRLGGWIEGSFVFTSRGFGAVALDSVEPVRPAHSDLELATCEMAAGLDEP